MQQPANPERGEVELVIEGKTYVLCAMLKGVAAWTKEVGATTQPELLHRLNLLDPQTLLAGARNLCRAEQRADLVERLHFRHFAELQGALLAALTFGMPEADEGNAGAAGTEGTETSPPPGPGGAGLASRPLH